MSIPLSLSLSLSLALQPLWTMADFFSFVINTQSVGLFGRGISPSQGRYLYTERHKHRINKQTSMPREGFEPTIPVFERAKTVHALDRAATEIDSLYVSLVELSPS
jgi:hypothetical protein